MRRLDAAKSLWRVDWSRPPTPAQHPRRARPNTSKRIKVSGTNKTVTVQGINGGTIDRCAARILACAFTGLRTPKDQVVTEGWSSQEFGCMLTELDLPRCVVDRRATRSTYRSAGLRPTDGSFAFDLGGVGEDCQAPVQLRPEVIGLA